MNFYREAFFYSCQFLASESTEFISTTFHNPAQSFNSCKFKGDLVDFRGTTFLSQSGGFWNCVFESDTTNFSPSSTEAAIVSFINCHFKGSKSYFYRPSSIELSPSDFRFTFNFKFYRTHFEGFAFFQPMTIIGEYGELLFDNLTFSESGKLLLNNFTPNRYKITFENIILHDTKEHLLLINDTLMSSSDNFQKSAKKRASLFKFKKCSFRPGNVIVSHQDLRTIRISRGNGYAGFKFDHCIWKTRSVPEKMSRRLRKYFKLRLRCANTEGYESSKELLSQQRLIYERLKKEAIDQGDQQLANDFYFWQMWYRLKNASNVLERIVLELYLATSAFGLSLLRPILWLVTLFFVFGDIYSLIFLSLPRWAAFPYIPTNLAEKGLQLSFLHSYTPGDLDFTKTSAWLDLFPNVKFAPIIPTDIKLWVGALLFIQYTLTAYLVYQLIVAIRNKVKW